MENQGTHRIDIPYPDAAGLHLMLTVGACRVRVTPGDEALWVAGTYSDPTGGLPHRIVQEGGTVQITQTHDLGQWTRFVNGPVPRFDLAFGKAKPYQLTLQVGASENSFDLGGLPIERLVIKHGAGKAEWDFSAPNPQGMSLLDIEAGAANLEMRNLANAHFAEMNVHGGAAAYKFDFSGELQGDANVKITTGMAAVEIRVPASTAARIETETLLGGLSIGDGLMKKQGAFWTEAAVAGRTPVLKIHVSVAMGSLKITSI